MRRWPAWKCVSCAGGLSPWHTNPPSSTVAEEARLSASIVQRGQDGPRAAEARGDPSGAGAREAAHPGDAGPVVQVGAGACACACAWGVRSAGWRLVLLVSGSLFGCFSLSRVARRGALHTHTYVYMYICKYVYICICCVRRRRLRRRRSGWRMSRYTCLDAPPWSSPGPPTLTITSTTPPPPEGAPAWTRNPWHAGR